MVTVFCGSAAGARSARVGHPYAGRGNRFWPILAETGLTPRILAPHESGLLPGLGIGLTDVNKTESGSDASLSGEGDDPEALRAKIAAVRPALLAFAGKRPAKVFLGAVFGIAEFGYGVQETRLGETEIHVLPSPSGLAIRWWRPEFWHRLADRHRQATGG